MSTEKFSGMFSTKDLTHCYDSCNCCSHLDITLKIPHIPIQLSRIPKYSGFLIEEIFHVKGF